MTVYFIHIYHYFRNHRLVCWLSMVALFAFFGYFATQLHLEEDINKLMPSSKNEDGTTKLAFADLKIKDKTFLLFEGNDVEKLTQVCDAFADSVKKDSALMGCLALGMENPPIGLIGEVKHFECQRRPLASEKVCTSIEFGFTFGDVTIATGESHIEGELIAKAQLKIFVQQ